MMTGVVSGDREARLLVVVNGRDGREQTVASVVDTGFNGFLTLTGPIITALDLEHHSFAVAMLGDGSRVTLSKYEAMVSWDGQERDILVLETDGGPLLGMSLLHGSRLTVDVWVGGRVRVEAPESES